MKRVLLSGLLFLLAHEVLAHRLDEYLQATRLAVATNRIELSIDLTPGVAVADQVLAVIDENRDGRVSADEAAAYAQALLKDIRLGLDERMLDLSMVETSFPALREIRSGTGLIRVKATAAIERPAAGAHALSLTNAHLPAISVYLVNALVPKDRLIKIARQSRDELQKGYRLEFSVNSSSP